MKNHSFKDGIINMLKLEASDKKDNKPIIYRLLLVLLIFFIVDALLSIIPVLNSLGYINTTSLMWMNFFLVVVVLIGLIGLRIEIRKMFLPQYIDEHIGASDFNLVIVIISCFVFGIVTDISVSECLDIMFVLVFLRFIAEQIFLLFLFFQLAKKINRQD